jgi:hypothetical protein
MQCYRCGSFVYAADPACHACGSPLRLGENLCHACFQPVLCEACGGDRPRSELFNDTPSPAQPAPESVQTYTLRPLEYEYLTIPISFRLSPDEGSSQRFYQQFHQILVERTLAAALDGWQTVDPLEYPILDQLGLIDHGWKALLGWQTVKLRLKRLTGERKAK